MDSTAPDNHPHPPASRRPRDMVISLVVLLVPLLVLVGGYQLLAGRTQPAEVDPSSTIMAARSAGFEVVQPAGLEPGWVLVSAVFRNLDEGATIRLGYVTPDGGSVQLVQSTVPISQLLAAELAEAGEPAGEVSPTGEVDVGGTIWQRYPGRPGETALVLRDEDRTLVVVGSAHEPELRELAASVR